jgi:hypothetical protein
MTNVIERIGVRLCIYVAMEIIQIPTFAYFNLLNLFVQQSPLIMCHISALLYSNITFF